jgi:hypothetical protein
MMTFTANLYTRGADEVCRGFDSDGLALVLVLVLASPESRWGLGLMLMFS